jgi:hypothetical protein
MSKLGHQLFQNLKTVNFKIILLSKKYKIINGIGDLVDFTMLKLCSLSQFTSVNKTDRLTSQAQWRNRTDVWKKDTKLCGKPYDLIIYAFLAQILQSNTSYKLVRKMFCLPWKKAECNLLTIGIIERLMQYYHF